MVQIMIQSLEVRKTDKAVTDPLTVNNAIERQRGK